MWSLRKVLPDWQRLKGSRLDKLGEKTPAVPAKEGSANAKDEKAYAVQKNIKTVVSGLVDAHRASDWRAISRLLKEFEQSVEPDSPNRILLLVASGGLDVLMKIFLDPFHKLSEHYTTVEGGAQPGVRPTASPSLLSQNIRGARTIPREAPFGRQRDKEHILQIMNSIALLFTELLLSYNDMGWYFYDLYPGVFFRILELIEAPHVGSTVGCLLEHLISCVGPVLEIAKVPKMRELLRSPCDAVFVIMARVVALLVVPGTERDFVLPHRRLQHEECAIAIKRMQRIVDSNVLWLLGEKTIIRRIIGLCEVQTRNIRVQQGDHVVTVMANTPADNTPMTLQMDSNAINLLNERMGDNPENLDFYAILREVMMQAGQNGGNVRMEVPGMEDAEPFFTGNNDNSESDESSTSDAEWIDVDSVHRGTPDPEGEEEGTVTSVTPSRSPNDHNENELSTRQTFTDMPWENLEMMNAFLKGYQEGERTDKRKPRHTADEEALSSVDQNSNSGEDQAPPTAPANHNNNNDTRGAPNGTAAVQDEFIQQIIDEDALSSDFISSLDYKWFLGTVGFRQRWRLQDLSLLPDRDDNRAEVLHFYEIKQTSEGVVPAQKVFQEENQRMLEALFNKAEVMQIWRQFRSTEKQMVVESQSELLFILNVMLSTFYFSEIWQQTREANWLQRAVKIFDSVFGLDSASGEVVDVLPHVEVPEELKRLSRFQPAPAADTKDADDGVCDLFKPNYPSHWQLPPFKEMSNKADRKSNYWLHKGVSPVDDDEEFREEKGHHHGPDTIRKLELLRGVHEFWHAQDVSECQMLLESHNASYAGTLGYKILTILRDSEDSCVETAACDALEALVRAYSYPFGSERYQTCSPQSLMAKDFMRRVLVEMVYNGTRVPSLPNSISPSKRLMGYFCLLGELIRYHFGNAKYLCDYVEGLVPLAQLRKQTTSGPRRSRFQPSRWRQEDPILQNPPLERQEEEPFGSVFLRRLYENPNDSNLLLRSLILTLTPGLRSSKNYIHKQLDGSVTLVPHSELPFSGRSADLVINHHYRLGYVRTTSRQYTIEISKLLAQHPHATREEKVDLAGPLVVELLRALVNSPHRLTPDERPYPDLLSENDISYVLDERVIPSHSPPAAMAVSLFEQSRTDSDGLSALAPLVSLLDAPHRLLYACIQSFNMEYIQSTARLCVITTAVLLCLRVSHLYGGEGAIIALLESVRPFALDSLAEWRKVCEKQRRKKNTPQCSCNESSGKPCQSFLLYGCCNPQHDSVVYHNAYGGCFYRNFFRLLCLWFGHYWTCQRYVGTLYFCSEIPFAEYKNTALTLMKHLPSFFLDKDEE